MYRIACRYCRSVISEPLAPDQTLWRCPKCDCLWGRDLSNLTRGWFVQLVGRTSNDLCRSISQMPNRSGTLDPMATVGPTYIGDLKFDRKYRYEGTLKGTLDSVFSRGIGSVPFGPGYNYTRIVQCPVCNVDFSNKTDLNRHLSLHIRQDLPEDMSSEKPADAPPDKEPKRLIRINKPVDETTKEGGS